VERNTSLQSGSDPGAWFSWLQYQTEQLRHFLQSP
jgi:hypothetical protein